MAQLIEALAITGSRKSDGSANASGKLWAYVPGTTTPRTLYADSDAATPLTQPVALSAAGKAVAYLTSSADLRIEDSTGATLDTFTYGARDGLVEVVSDAFTGTLPSGSQGAGGITDLPTALLALGMSLGTGNGGVDGKFHGRYGTVSTNVWEELESIWFNVKRFGAVGDGVHDDTTNIQAALNAAAANGGGVVYLFPGTFLISAALTIGTAGVSLKGAGFLKSIVKNSGTTTGVLIQAGGSAFVEDVGFTAASSSTAACIALSSTGFSVNRISIAGHRQGITGLSTSFVSNSTIVAVSDAASRGATVTGANVTLLACSIDPGALGTAVELTMILNDTANFAAIAVTIPSAVNRGYYINCLSTWGFALIGGKAKDVTIAAGGGVQILGTTLTQNPPINDTTTSTWAFNVAAAGSCNPDPNYSSTFEIRGTSTGVINIQFSKAVWRQTPIFYICHTNAAAGGPCTFTFGAQFSLAGGVMPAPAVGNSITVGFVFDAVATQYVEIFRSAAVATP